MDGNAAPAREPAPGLLERWATAARGPSRILLCVAALSLPTFWIAPHSDDYHIAVRVQQDPLGGFRFERSGEALEHRGWWLPRAGHLRFFRPISSLTHWVDFALWPSSTLLMRLHSVLWYALLVLAVWALHRRLLATHSTALLATLMYAANGPHATSIGWLAARNTAIATLFGVLTLLLHDRGCREGRRSARWLAPLALLLSLLSAEFGVGALGYLVAYEWLLMDGPRARRALRLIPHAAVAALWWAYYVASGHGVADSVWYHDAGSDPLGFVVASLYSAPIYVATQLTLPVAGLAALTPATLAAFVVGSSALLLVLGRLMWPTLKQHRAARFCLAGAALSTLPLGTTRPQDRLVLLLAVGLCALLALWLQDARRTALSRVQRVAYGALYRAHLLWRPLLFIAVPFIVVRLLAAGERELEAALPLDPQAGVLLLNPPNAFVPEQPPVIRAHLRKPYPRYAYLLYAGRERVLVRRLDQDTLELHAAGGWRQTRLSEVTWKRFVKGERLQLRHMRVEVADVNDAGVPTVARFHFDRPLREGAPLLLAWDDVEPRPVPMLEVGGKIAL